jgi:predicted nuclease of restriction endonuclease-like (RecB) superfamily
MKKQNITLDDYPKLLLEIKERVRFAQYEALRAVNKELVGLYWDIGKIIVSRQYKSHYGKTIVEQLALDLQKEFPGIPGFSVGNLWRMRAFFENYGDSQKLAPLVRELAWSHNVVIMEKCKDELEREFYIRIAKKFGWSKNVLIHQIENQTYEKSLLGQTNFDKTLTPKLRSQAKLAVKDEYTFGFLELSDEHSEKELENALISRIENFLQTMGGSFAFIGRQFRLEVDGEEFFIDLLLFHRKLKSLVAIELKIGKFQPEYVGKMQFYLAALNDRFREQGENAPIGIILCKNKNKTIVEYALQDSKKPIGIATYSIRKTLPKELQKQLPKPQEISNLLEAI